MPYIRYIVGDFIIEEDDYYMSTSDKGKCLEYSIAKYLRSRGVNCRLYNDDTLLIFAAVLFRNPFDGGRPTIDELKGVLSTRNRFTIGVVASFSKKLGIILNVLAGK
ncbi:23631_t:CDS:2 [Racocetra persica]|uniref:23631_t:CDS:1 n=1 Tax=Racocetra persica TaxID=160502 RepID=A0ACA9LMA9_9GLOM|nr:23631_t:CDS:2 [Racocetra persica]